MADAKTILILGGGIGGQVVANELRQSLPREHRITIIERDLTHAFAPSFLWVMTGDRRPEQPSVMPSGHSPFPTPKSGGTSEPE